MIILMIDLLLFVWKQMEHQNHLSYLNKNSKNQTEHL